MGAIRDIHDPSCFDHGAFWNWDEPSQTVIGSEVPPGAGVVIRKNGGSDVGTRGRVNMIEGQSITVTVADDPTDNELDVTVAVNQINGGYF